MLGYNADFVAWLLLLHGVLLGAVAGGFYITEWLRRRLTCQGTVATAQSGKIDYAR